MKKRGQKDRKKEKETVREREGEGGGRETIHLTLFDYTYFISSESCIRNQNAAKNYYVALITLYNKCKI